MLRVALRMLARHISQSVQEALVLMIESIMWPRCVPGTPRSTFEKSLCGAGDRQRLVTSLARMM